MTALAPFAKRLLDWFDRHGRHDLPWQRPRSAYRVWVAEVMLQQTQVKTVIPYFERFLRRFPDLPSLAAASLDEVLALWAGLGYYARGRNLHRAAQAAVAAHGGELPRDFDALHALPGIGLSTAGAILAQAHGAPHAILDGNVRRVLARHAAIADWPGSPVASKQLWAISRAHLPATRLADYTQAIMDLGATVCTPRAPRCAECPVREDCVALQSGRVAQLPAPRPRRTYRQREATLLLVNRTQDESWLLERRPPSGIWGGLWSPPLLEDAEGVDSLAHLRARYGIEAELHASLPPLRHAFTHFEYRIQPLHLRLLRPLALRDGGQERWITLAETRPAMPAPIERLFALSLPHLECPPEPSTA